ncbi:MAG: GNAT family N-acetyltransferase [Ktedonobacteraceae bacterium]
MTDPSITITPATMSMLPTIAWLIRLQGIWQHRQDPRLYTPPPMATVATLTSALTQPRANATRPLVAVDVQGQLRGYVEPSLWELSAHSPLLAFLTQRNGIARHLIVPTPEEPGASTVMTALLTALAQFWRWESVTADLIRWPSSDAWLAPLLTAHGFRLDSVCALAPVSVPLPVSHADERTQRIRLAHPDDETALVALFTEEVRAHEPVVPSARLRPSALAGFRAKLHHLWSGDPLEDGAPLVLVCEDKQQVVGMAEVSLLTVNAGDEPGFTPPGCYGCLDNVSVHDGMRGHGIGRQLVQAVCDAFAARSLHLDGYVLWYNPDNVQAARFWPFLGFRPLWTTYQRLHDPT